MTAGPGGRSGAVGLMFAGWRLGMFDKKQKQSRKKRRTCCEVCKRKIFFFRLVYGTWHRNVTHAACLLGFGRNVTFLDPQNCSDTRFGFSTGFRFYFTLFLRRAGAVSYKDTPVEAVCVTAAPLQHTQANREI